MSTEVRVRTSGVWSWLSLFLAEGPWPTHLTTQGIRSQHHPGQILGCVLLSFTHLISFNPPELL